MKKTLLLSVAMLVAGSAISQEATRHHDGFYFDKMSANGKYLATQALGSVFIYDGANDEYYEYYASEDAVSEYYATGLGNCISNDGILVGGVNDATCAYWREGEWQPLSVKPENQALNMANGITPDGSRIVGSVGNMGMDMNSSQMIKPVYWDRNEEGQYDIYNELPYPRKDFCGRTPQYISAVAISDDGKTIVGQIVDWSGFYTYPIIYTQDATGEWSYRTIDEGVIYAEGTEFAPWPGEMPNPEEYMTEEELAEYREAMRKYEEEVIKYNNGQTNEYPEEPNADDYICEYYNEYSEAMREYANMYYAFEEKLMESTYNINFIFNNVYLSGNGRYYSTTVESLDVSNPLSPKSLYTPVCFDLHNGDSMVKMANTTNMIASSAMNDGRFIAQTPYMAYARNSFIVSQDGLSKVAFVDYISGIDSAVGEWVKNYTCFDVLSVSEYDEYGYPIDYTVVEDSIVSGSVHCNAEGTIFCSFMYDEWSDYVSYREFSYTIDLTQLNAIEGVENDGEMNVYVADNQLYVNGDVTAVTLYDMRGVVVARIENPTNGMPLNVENGIYLVRSEGNNGNGIYKVAIQ